MKPESTSCNGTAAGPVAALVPMKRIERCILVFRGQRVMLDADLAELYGVTVGRLNEAVRRNRRRLPSDFMFQLSPSEWNHLKSQFAISSSQWGGRRSRPYAFTEQGVAMLSSVLRSPRAIAVNIEIMRAFVRLRRTVAGHKELARRIQILDRRFTEKTAAHEAHIRKIYEVLELLMEPPAESKKGRIGFRAESESYTPRCRQSRGRGEIRT